MSPKRIYLLFELFLGKNFWIRLDLRFSVPRRNLENSTKTPLFCFTTEFEETGSSGSCDVYPGRLNVSGPVISFTMVQYTFEKCAETPSRSAISCCSNIPDLKRDILYNLLAIIGQWYNKDVNCGFILSNRNKRSESVRTIEELSLELLPQTSKSYFQNFLLEANQQFATYIFQFRRIYNIAGKVV